MAGRNQKDKTGFCALARANEPPSYPLSHHPNCARFVSHTFLLGQFRFCIGCYIGYPSAICAIVLGTGFYLLGLVTIWHLFGFGMAGYFALLLSLSRGKFPEVKIVKMIQKISIGAGSGFLLVVGFFLFDISLVIRISIISLLLLGLIIPIRAVHLRKTTQICASCELKGTDPHCTA